MAEPLVNGLDPRKKLYSALVGSSDKELAGQVKQFSYNKFNGLLDNNDFVRDLFMDISERGIVLDPKNPNASKDPVEFANAFIYREPVAKPQPKVQAAPKQEFLEVPSLEEQEAYTPPPPQPLIGTPEYDVKLQKQYGGMSPTLGATFGGVPASFETEQQKKKEQLSPVFKAQQLAFEDVPIAEEQRKAQRQFAKATKQEKEAALRGGTGFEIQQKRANEQREATQKLKDFGSSLGVTFDNMINKIKAAEAMFGAKQRALLTFGEKGKKAEEQEKKIKQQVLGYLDQVDQDFATKQAEYNIEGNIYDVISKGQLDRLPEAFAYNLAQIGINALGAGTTGGYSTFAQVVPDMYKAGVEEIARKTNTTPEEVIASGKDKEVIAYTAGAISGGIDYFSSGLLGQAMRSKGAYKFLRDLALNKIGKTKWKQAAASAAALGGVANIEGLTEGAQGLIEVAAPQVASAKSFKEARENIYGELQKPSTQRRLASDIVGGAAGGGGLVAGGRGLERLAQGDFTYGDVRETIQRADMDIVQTDNKIQERNKIAQAMEEAVKGNPEAEGQIREQYQKRVNEAAPTDEEVLNAYEGLAALPETEEKNTIRENLEAYMAEKGIQPEAAGMDAGLGEGLRVTAPSEEAPVIQTVNPQFPPPQPPAPTETAPLEEAPAEEAIQEDEDLASLGQTISGLEQAPAEPVTETPKAGSVVGGEVELKDDFGDRKSIIYKGKKVGYVEVPNDLEGDTISLGDININPEFRGKGIGVEVYKILIKTLDKPLESFDRTPEAKKVWDSLVKQGYAKKVSNGYISIKAVEQPFKETPQEVAPEAAPAPKGKKKAAPATLPKELLGKTTVSSTGFGGDREHTTGTVSLEDLKVLDVGIETARQTLETDKSFKPSRGPIVVGVDVNTGEKQLLDGYHRYLLKSGKGEVSAKFIPMKNGGIISFEEAKAAPVTPTPAAPKKGVKDMSLEELETESKSFDEKIKAEKERLKKVAPNRQIVGGADIDNLSPDDAARYVELNDEVGRRQGTSQEEAKQRVAEKREQRRKEQEAAKELTFEKQKEYEQVQGTGEETRKEKSTPKAERAVRPKAKPVRNAGKTPDAIAARNIAFYGNPAATTLQYLMDATYHPDLLESIFGGPSKTTKSGRKDISGERRSRIQFLDNNSNVKTADKLAEVLAERYAEENSITVKDAEQQHDFASIATDIVSSYSSRSQMVRELLRLNDQQSEAFDFMYNPEEIYGEGYNEDIAKDIDGILDELPDSYWEGKEISDEDFGNLFAEEVESETKAEAEFTSKQESSASQEFDGMKKPSKIKTKSFDGKHGKGAFERMKNITDNFEDIIDGMSGKIKQDCL